ncbi:MAG TPA: EAL domain-containing protein [Noviherbaspirillum sp.]|nr:EAL domain-containing protein [Noviherbaspirillum sp.]
MDKQQGRQEKRPIRTPGGIVLLYALFAAAWIAVSDRIAVFLFSDLAQFERVGTLKGMFFIAVTSLLLYVLIRKGQASLDHALATSTHYQERLERVLRGTNDGWWDWDLENNRIYYSPRCWEMLGYEPDALPADSGLWRRLIHPDDIEQAERGFKDAIADHEQGYSVEIRLRHKAGHYVPVLSRYMVQRNDEGVAVLVSGTNMDLTERKASESKLDFLAHRDPLTLLPNRVLLLSHLEHGIRAAQRDGTRLALLMLDLDHFKDVNDSLGHSAGDELLKLAAERLGSRLRGMDAVARLGGDEFAVVLPHIAAAEDAGMVANEIMGALSSPLMLPGGIEVRTGASIGISIFPDHGATTQELLQHADAALYGAKREGRGCFRYFSQNLTHAARERIDLEARLHRAIGQDELRVYFQPLVDIATGRIRGAEALVRWLDPKEGLIPPSRFIPVAESTGLIASVGEWVLRNTCLHGKKWIDAGLPRLTLAVNISPRQFLHGDLGATVARILDDTGFPATSLELELTESALMEREQDVVALLNCLRAIGVRLAIDDFGTGYSSLAHLKRFPLDVLKIDKGFIDDIPHRADDGAIAAAIVAMGHTLGFKVLAEGVENEGQLAFLRSLGCDMYQGYLASRPVPAEEFEKLLQGRPAL